MGILDYIDAKKKRPELESVDSQGYSSKDYKDDLNEMAPKKEESGFNEGHIWNNPAPVASTTVPEANQDAAKTTAAGSAGAGMAVGGPYGAAIAVAGSMLSQYMAAQAQASQQARALEQRNYESGKTQEQQGLSNMTNAWARALT